MGLSNFNWLPKDIMTIGTMTPIEREQRLIHYYSLEISTNSFAHVERDIKKLYSFMIKYYVEKTI